MTTKQTITDQLNILLNDFSHESPDTRKSYMSKARRFLVESGDFSRAGMKAYLENMGYNDNSVRTTYYTLKRLCKALGTPFPLDEKQLPPAPDEDELNTPTISVDNIKRLINYWKQSPGDYTTALVFLSTMYGLRSIEMTSIEVLMASFVMKVAKRKGRANKPVMREHLIPAGMEQYLSGYYPISERTVNYTFHKACRAIGYKPREHENWHAVRRALNTAMRDVKTLEPSGTPGIMVEKHIDDMLISRFMRWAKPRSLMTSTYTHHEFADINREMFLVHPFLKLWK